MSAIDRLEAEEHLHTAVREMREAGADDKEILHEVLEAMLEVDLETT